MRQAFLFEPSSLPYACSSVRLEAYSAIVLRRVTTQLFAEVVVVIIVITITISKSLQLAGCGKGVARTDQRPRTLQARTFSFHAMGRRTES